MNLKAKIGVFSLVLIGIVGVNMFIVTKENPSINASTDSSPITHTVVEQTLTDIINLNGKVLPLKEEYIFLDETKGKVKEIHVNEGDAIKKGNPILVYQNEELNLQLEQAELAKSRSLIQIEQLNHQEKELDKRISDSQKVAPSTSENPLEEEIKTVQFQKRIANLDYKEAELTIKNINSKVKELTVTSPIDGVISKINPIGTGSAGDISPLVYITSGEEYIISGNLSEYDLPFINEGDPVIVKAKAIPNETFPGVISNLGKIPLVTNSTAQMSAENSGSIYPFQVNLTKQNKTLQSGYKVDVEVQIKGDIKKPVVPVESIMTDDKGEFVFIVMEDKKLKKQYIETGLIDQENKEVLKGLKPTNEILLNPNNETSDGMELGSDD